MSPKAIDRRSGKRRRRRPSRPGGDSRLTSRSMGARSTAWPALLLIACDPYEEQATPSDAGTTDAVVDSSVGATGVDGGADAADGGATSCSAHPTAVICDDFEGAFPGAWASYKTDAGVNVVGAPGFFSPQSLVATVPANAMDERAFVTRDFDLATKTTFRISARVRMDVHEGPFTDSSPLVVKYCGASVVSVPGHRELERRLPLARAGVRIRCDVRNVEERRASTLRAGSRVLHSLRRARARFATQAISRLCGASAAR